MALDSYENVRRPVAQDVVHLAERLTRVTTVEGNVARAARNSIIGLLDHVAPFKRSLAMQLSEVEAA